MNDYVIELKNIRKRFGQIHALDGLDLNIARGEIYALLGPNGSGKTTALRIICGLLEADSGAGQCFEKPIGRSTGALGSLGYMPQRGNLYDDLTVTENLRFFAEAHGLADCNAAVEHTIAQHQLGDRARQRVGTLSGGWRQRVAFVAATLHQPALLLLDEPTAGLDPEARESLWAAIERAALLQQTTVLVTTHYAEEASRSDRLGYLLRGRLQAEAAPHQLSRDLNLSVWLADKTLDGANANAERHYCLTRTSAGWRIIGANTAADKIKFGFNQQAIALTAVTPELADAIAWLGHAGPGGHSGGQPI